MPLIKTNISNDIIEKVKQDDYAAYEIFFNNYYAEIFNFLYKHTFDYETAKDLAQETFIKFWEVRKRIDVDKHPRAYLFKISKNLAINYSEKKKEILFSENDEHSFSASSVEDIESGFFAKDVQKAILKLSEQRRTIFILSRYHGFKYSEIAELLDISVQTVKNQMSQTFAILKKKLQVYLTKD